MRTSPDSRVLNAPSARLTALMLGVFLGGGLLASVEALLVPRLKLAMHTGYARALIIQLVYYAGYLLFAWPAAALAARIGIMRAIAIGLGLMAIGCCALVGAQVSQGFTAALAALLLISSGVTMLQIACNGVMATLGDRNQAAARFTMLQGFNALGTVAGPLMAAWFLLGSGNSGRALLPFLAFAALFGALALAFARHRDLLVGSPGLTLPTPSRLADLIGRRRVASGVAAIFAYVGAEVAIGTLAVSYLMRPDRLGAGAVAAGQLVSLYWAGAMVGRFMGAWALGRIAAERLLAIASMVAIALLMVAMLAKGWPGSAALLGVGFANSIMFPTIYGLAMPKEAEEMPAAAMLLCMAVVGGAIIPMATGLVADRLGLIDALILPGLCYAAILLFARAERR